MAYLLETKLLENKSIFFALKSIYGIGEKKSYIICKKLGFSINLMVNDLSKDQLVRLVTIIEMSSLIINTDLKKLQVLALKHLIDIKSYKGLRQIKGLPIRGQRTHTNAKTARRYKKT